MIDWKTKLCSRKFWLAVVGFVTGLLTFLGVGTEQADKIGSLILMAASIAAYIIGEGLADAAGAQSNGPVIVAGELPEIDEVEDEEEEEG